MGCLWGALSHNSSPQLIPERGLGPASWRDTLLIMSLTLVSCAFDSPDAQRLIAEVQQEYVVRYGDEDVTPVDPAEFTPPLGYFVVGYLDGVPVACGGWRVHEATESADFLDGDAELKRMYVAPEVRGKGFARQ